MCFFRALVLHNGCHVKNLKCNAKHYYQRYRATRPQKKKFCGVQLKELSDLEQLFEVNIFVYLLEPTKPDGDKDDEGNEDDKPEIATTSKSIQFWKHWNVRQQKNLKAQAKGFDS